MAAHGKMTQDRVAHSTWVEEFPNNFLSVDENKLHCKACSMELGLKNSIIALHVKSLRCEKGKDKLKHQDE